MSFPPLAVDETVENSVGLWMEWPLLWTLLWSEKNFEKSLGKPLRSVAEVT